MQGTPLSTRTTCFKHQSNSFDLTQTDSCEGGFPSPRPQAGHTKLSGTDLVLITWCSALEQVVNPQEVYTGNSPACPRVDTEPILAPGTVPHRVLCTCAQPRDGLRHPADGTLLTGPTTRTCNLSTSSSSRLLMKPIAVLILRPNSFRLCSFTCSCPLASHGLEAPSGAQSQQVPVSPQAAVGTHSEP